MDGKLLAFDDDTQRGEIEGNDGKRYRFDFAQWRGRGLPQPGSSVRFDPEDESACRVFNRPEAQRRATTTRTREGHTARKQLSHWALAALVVSAVGISAGSYAALVEIPALILAWVALRHIHRQPQRFNGTIVACAAIVVSVGVTLWSQL